MNGDIYQGNKMQTTSIYREHPGLMRPPKWMRRTSRVKSMVWGWLALAGVFAMMIMGLLLTSTR